MQVYLHPYKLEEYEALVKPLGLWPFPRGHQRHLTWLPIRGAAVLLADQRSCPLLPAGLRVLAHPGLEPTAAQRGATCDSACRCVSGTKRGAAQQGVQCSYSICYSCMATSIVIFAIQGCVSPMQSDRAHEYAYLSETVCVSGQGEGHGMQPAGLLVPEQLRGAAAALSLRARLHRGAGRRHSQLCGGPLHGHPPDLPHCPEAARLRGSTPRDRAPLPMRPGCMTWWQYPGQTAVIPNSVRSWRALMADGSVEWRHAESPSDAMLMHEDSTLWKKELVWWSARTILLERASSVCMSPM